MIHCGGHERGVVRKYARLKVASAAGLYSHPGAGQVGRPYVGLLHVENEYLEVHPGAQGPLQPRKE